MANAAELDENFLWIYIHMLSGRNILCMISALCGYIKLFSLQPARLSFRASEVAALEYEFLNGT